MKTPNLRVTRVIRAEVAIFAIRFPARDALALFADITNGTHILVITNVMFIGRFETALSGSRFTDRLEAGSICSLGFRALDDGIRVHLAKVRQFGHIAKERAIAEVVIFEFLTVEVYLALTIDI